MLRLRRRDSAAARASSTARTITSEADILPFLMALNLEANSRSGSSEFLPEWVYQQGARLAIALASFAVIWCWVAG